MTVDRARPGRRFGPYELLEAIGHGGSAVVYRAHDLRPDAPARDVAVKLIASAFAAEPEFRARFRQEAALVRRLRHRHVLAVYDSGEAGPEGPGTSVPPPGRDGLATGYAYLVTEYCAGGALDITMRRTRSTRERCRLALEVATQIGSALDAAHDADILHRDVKPSNILVAADGHLVLGDFGLARALQDGPGQHLTMTGHVTGTPAYMAPEQASGEAADSRTDLYGLAVVLFEIVTGSVPFRAETAMAVMLAHVHQPPPRATDIAPGVPSAVSDVLARALDKSRDARYPSGAALASALHQALASTGRAPTPGASPVITRTGRTGAGAPLGDVAPGGARRLTPRTTLAARGRRGRGWTRLVPMPVRVVGAVAALLFAATAVLAAGGVLGDGATGLDGLAAAMAEVPGRVRAAIESWRADDDPPTVTEALMPSTGRAASLRAGLTIRFSRPMDVASVESNLQYEPPAALDFEWNGQLVVVTPRVDLAPGTEYVITLGAGVLARDGRPLARPIEHRFTTRTAADATASPGVPTAAPDRIVPGGVTATPVGRTPTVRPLPTVTARPTAAPTVRPSATAATPRPAEAPGAAVAPGTTAAPGDATPTASGGTPAAPGTPGAVSTPVAIAPGGTATAPPATGFPGPSTPAAPMVPAFATAASAAPTRPAPAPTVTPAYLAIAPTTSPVPTPTAGATVVIIFGATAAPSATVAGPRLLPTLPPTAVAYPTPAPALPAASPTVAIVATPTAGFIIVIPTVGTVASPTAPRTPTRVPASPTAGTGAIASGGAGTS